MNSISIPIYVESRYKVNRKKIKETVITTLLKQEIESPVEVSIAVIGNRKMKALNKRYRGIDAPTNVLSFPQNEGNVIMPQPTDKIYLGDVVLCYPKVVEECARDNMLIDDRVNELIQHSLKHLLGIHHG
jgi:probable rRNA maturation factor